MRDFTWFSFTLAKLALEILIDADVLRMLKVASNYCNLSDDKLCMWLLANPRHVTNIECDRCIYKKRDYDAGYFEL